MLQLREILLNSITLLLLGGAIGYYRGYEFFIFCVYLLFASQFSVLYSLLRNSYYNYRWSLAKPQAVPEIPIVDAPVPVIKEDTNILAICQGRTIEHPLKYSFPIGANIYTLNRDLLCKAQLVIDARELTKLGEAFPEDNFLDSITLELCGCHCSELIKAIDDDYIAFLKQKLKSTGTIYILNGWITSGIITALINNKFTATGDVIDSNKRTWNIWSQ